jgi:alkylation response protein AidB-like acyl-CoA dehydrogenase
MPNGAGETPRARAAMAAEAVGVAQRALDLGIEHAKTRVQFGKPIGTYQAVSHQLADTYTDVELARSLAYWAAWCVAEEDEQAAIAAAAAKAFATEAAVAACERSIQVHGGIGFTWEHALHRFYKRALDLGVEHAKTREQFGKPIGTYQAVSHPLAQTYTDVELARSLAYWAAWCVAEDDERAALAAASAKAFATEAAVSACERSIQVHGGTGFTWEHPLHRFYKRALWLEGLGSRPAELRLEVADAVLGVSVPV